MVGFGRPEVKQTVSNAMKQGSAVIPRTPRSLLAATVAVLSVGKERGWDRFRNGYVSAVQQSLLFQDDLCYVQ